MNVLKTVVPLYQVTFSEVQASSWITSPVEGVEGRIKLFGYVLAVEEEEVENDGFGVLRDTLSRESSKDVLFVRGVDEVSVPPLCRSGRGE